MYVLSPNKRYVCVAAGILEENRLFYVFIRCKEIQLCQVWMVEKKHIVCQLLLGRQHCVLFRDMSFVNGKRIFGFWEKNSRTKEAAVEIYFSDPFNCLECGFWLRIDLHGRIYHVRLVQMVLHMKILVESMTLKKRNLFIIGKCSGE